MHTKLISVRGTVASILRMTIFFQESALTDPTCMFDSPSEKATANPDRGLGQPRHLDSPRRRHHHHRSLSAVDLAADRADSPARTDEQGVLAEPRAPVHD